MRWISLTFWWLYSLICTSPSPKENKYQTQYQNFAIECMYINEDQAAHADDQDSYVCACACIWYLFPLFFLVGIYYCRPKILVAHCNGTHEPNFNGIHTYYLSFMFHTFFYSLFSLLFLLLFGPALIWDFDLKRSEGKNTHTHNSRFVHLKKKKRPFISFTRSVWSVLFSLHRWRFLWLWFSLQMLGFLFFNLEKFPIYT